MALHDVLAEIYPDPDEARRLAEQINLDTGRLVVDGVSALQAWRSVASEAFKQQKHARLIAEAAVEYPAYADKLWNWLPDSSGKRQDTKLRRDLTNWNSRRMEDYIDRLRGLEDKLDGVKDSLKADLSTMAMQLALQQQDIERLRSDMSDIKRQFRDMPLQSTPPMNPLFTIAGVTGAVLAILLLVALIGRVYGWLETCWRNVDCSCMRFKSC